MVNKTSMLYWWPKVKFLPVPIPDTQIILNKGPNGWMSFLDGKTLTKNETAILHRALDSMGYPCFLRTDIFSGKHHYSKSCHITNRKDALSHIFELVEGSFMRDIGMNALVVREHLNLLSPFKAFSGLPISKERRYFAETGKVILHHPYWPEDAIEFFPGEPIPENWQEQLKQINIEEPVEISLLSRYASIISEKLDGPWSIDFAQTTDGLWYFIDAAEAMKSWIHPDYADNADW